ncbi:MAG: hypothetical protein IJR97_13325, partial [Clostridia bacterium]|nr:hypothetical protein [Clostridia bacterium]
MKQYTKKDLIRLRHQPTEAFCRTMKGLLRDLPDCQAETLTQKVNISGFARQLNGSFVKKTFVAAAAVLLFVSGLLMMRHNGQFAEQFTSPELITQVSSSEAPENGFIPVADGGIEESAGLLDRIDIFVEPDLLWNNETGILAEGDRIVKVPGTSYANAVYRNAVYREMSELERSAEAEIEYHSSQSGGSFRQRIRMSLSGDYYSMDMPQKSLMIEAADGSFEYPLFDHRTATAYVSFLLSNGGTDNLFTRLADGVQSRLIDKYLDTNLLTLAWKPVSVYLNG